MSKVKLSKNSSSTLAIFSLKNNFSLTKVDFSIFFYWHICFLIISYKLLPWKTVSVDIYLHGQFSHGQLLHYPSMYKHSNILSKENFPGLIMKLYDFITVFFRKPGNHPGEKKLTKKIGFQLSKFKFLPFCLKINRCK